MTLGTSNMDFTKLRRFAELTERKKAIEAEGKAIKAEMDALEPVIIEEMADTGLQNANINGRTYYINRRLFAGPAEGRTKYDVAEALKSAGLNEYVNETYNSNSLAAYVRQCVHEAEGASLSTEEMRGLLPEPLRDVLKIGDVFVLASRAS